MATISAPVLLPPRRVVALCGISTTTIHRLRKRGLFPEPVNLLSRVDGSASRVAYDERDILRWIEDRRSAPLPSATEAPAQPPRRPRGRPRKSVAV